MNWLDWLICRLWHKYNVVVCRALPPTWTDCDFLLLHASFQILEDFVHQERGHFYEDVYALYLEQGVEEATARQETWDTVRELYAWWNQRKRRLNDDGYEEDTAMLHKLIDIRPCLWT
jgi:hypothetical protein